MKGTTEHAGGRRRGGDRGRGWLLFFNHGMHGTHGMGTRRVNRELIYWASRVALGVFGVALAIGRANAESRDIDLATVLRLAGEKNLAVEMARERVKEARSVLEQDKQQLLPWLAPGVGYRRHDGNIQDVVGNVFDASKQSGTAALTLQAQLDLGDSIYRVLASKQSVRASEADADASRREVAATAAAAYVELLRAHAGVGVADESSRIAGEFLAQVRTAVDAGIAFAGDAVRAEVRAEATEVTRLKAREDTRVSSTRLAQLLRLPMAIELRPMLGEFLPVTLVDTNRALDSLVASAMARRPELRRTEARAAAARAARDGAAKGPWLPMVGAQAAAGGLVGGRNDGFGHGDDFQEYGVSVSWRIGPGGIGDRSRIRTAESRVKLAGLALEEERDAITREVIDARTRAETSAAMLSVVARKLAAAERLLALTRARREFGVGAVLEAIDAERELENAREEQVRVIADYNRRQWELWLATGDDKATGTGMR